MKKFIIITIFLSIFSLYSILTAKPYSPFETWVAEPPEIQLDKEGLDDEKGLGRIFVPAMSKPEYEPSYTVIQGDSIVKDECPVGQSVFLPPGTYTIVIGSAANEQDRIRKEITLVQGETEIIYPDWSGLIVKIIDENRDFLRESYEIFDINTYNSMGTQYSADEDEPGEYQDTWLLVPGMYKIVKYGEPFNTFRNFTTARLIPGELSTITIVMDSETGDFVGAGMLPEIAELKQEEIWNVYTSLKGGFLLSGDNEMSEDETQTNITLNTKLENEVRLDRFPHYLNMKQIVNVGLNKEEGREFRIYSNDLQLSNTYIFYFVKQFGVYTRFRFETKPFATKHYFSETQDTLYKQNSDGQLIETVHNTDEIETAPIFSPLRFEEGIGFNYTALKTKSASLSLKAGFGFSQTLNNDVFKQDPENPKIFREQESLYLEGLEASVTGDFRIFRNLNYFGELYTLYPFDEDRTQVVRWDNNFTFRISRFVAVDYTLSFIQDEAKDWTVYRHDLSVNLSIISF